MVTCAFVAHSAADSGAEQNMLSLMSHLTPQCRPVLVIHEDGPIADRARQLGIPTEVLAGGPVRLVRRTERNPLAVALSVLRLMPSVRRAAHSFKRHHVDVVVAIGTKAILYAGPAARLSGARVVWSLHDRVATDYFSRLVVPVLRFLLPRLVDGLMVNSRATLDTVRPGRTPVLVAYPGTTFPPVRRTADPDLDGDVAEVLMLGRLTPWKGQDVFLRAFARAFRGTDTRASVVGGALFGETDYEQELVDLTHELGINDRVELTGHVSDPWPYLERADLLVHASRVPEPFGQVVVQGMWSSCAVVATTPGGPAEVITDHVDGLLVPVDDEDALARALEELRTDDALRGRLRRAASVAAARFDAGVTAPPVTRWLAAVVSRGLQPRSVTVNLAGSGGLDKLDQPGPQQVANSTGPEERSDITD